MMALHERKFELHEKSKEEDQLEEAEYRGRKVKPNKPMRGDVKKFKVYVRDQKLAISRKLILDMVVQVPKKRRKNHAD